MTSKPPNGESLDRLELLLAFLAAAAAGIVYFATLAPTVTSGDSGELITAAFTLGIAHPPGYPLYCLIGKAFSLLPVSNVAWRVNVMSAAFGSLTVALVYLICRRLSIRRAAAFAGALALGVSRTFWSQSVISEVYTLNAFFICAVILLVLLWRDSKKNAYLYTAAGAFGLSLSNHYMLMLLVSPAIGIYVLWTNPKMLRDLRLVLGCAALGLAALLVYAYVPLAAARQPVMNWGELSTWHGFWSHVTRAPYRSVDFQTGFSLWAKLLFIGHLGRLLWNGFTPIALAPFGLLGCWALRGRKRDLALLGGTFLLNTVVLIFILQLVYSPDAVARLEPYYLPAFACTAVFIAAGISWAWSAVRAVGKKVPGAAVGIPACVAAVLCPLALNWKHEDMSRNLIAYDFNKTALESLEPNAIYVCGADFYNFPTIYLQAVEGIRRDVILADGPRYPTARLRRYLAALSPPVPPSDVDTMQGELIRRGNPIYSTPMSTSPNRLGTKLDPWGFVFRARRADQAVRAGAPAVFKGRTLRNIEIPTALGSFDCLLLSCYYLMRGETAMSEGHIRDAAPDYRKAAEYALPYPIVVSDIGVLCMRRSMNRQAEEFLRKAAEANPSYFGAYENLAALLERQGRFSEALSVYQNAQRLYPKRDYGARIAAIMARRNIVGSDVDHRIHAVRDALGANGRDPELLTALGGLCMLRGDLEEALAAYQKAVEVEPGYRPGYEALARFYGDVVQDPAVAAAYAAKARASGP